MFFRTPHNYDSDIDSHKSGLDCSDFPSLTQQHDKDDCDINRIVATYARTGVLPGGDPNQPPTYFETDEVFDFHSAANQIRAAQESFDAMPSAVRERFQNDPGNLMAFLSDSANADEARKLGLLNPLPEPTPTPTPGVSEPPASE